MGVYLSSKTEKGRDRKKGACPKERVEFTPTCVTFCCSPPKLFIRTEKGSLLWQAEDRLGERTQSVTKLYCKKRNVLQIFILDLIFIRPTSDHYCLALALRACYENLSKLLDLPNLIHGFLQWLHGFVKIDTWISQNWYMDFSKFIHGCLKVVTGICLGCYKLKFDQRFEAH